MTIFDNFWQLRQLIQFWKDSPGDLWSLRHWVQLWQLRTWIHDNLWCLTINCHTGLLWVRIAACLSIYLVVHHISYKNSKKRCWTTHQTWGCRTMWRQGRSGRQWCSCSWCWPSWWAPWTSSPAVGTLNTWSNENMISKGSQMPLFLEILPDVNWTQAIWLFMYTSVSSTYPCQKVSCLVGLLVRLSVRPSHIFYCWSPLKCRSKKTAILLACMNSCSNVYEGLNAWNIWWRTDEEELGVLGGINWQFCNIENRQYLKTRLLNT